MLSNQLLPYSMDLSNELKISCWHACQRYDKFLEEQKKEKKENSEEAAK